MAAQKGHFQFVRSHKDERRVRMMACVCRVGETFLEAESLQRKGQRKDEGNGECIWSDEWREKMGIRRKGKRKKKRRGSLLGSTRGIVRGGFHKHN